jgi:hypothetical protein
MSLKEYLLSYCHLLLLLQAIVSPVIFRGQVGLVAARQAFEIAEPEKLANDTPLGNPLENNFRNPREFSFRLY